MKIKIVHVVVITSNDQLLTGVIQVSRSATDSEIQKTAESYRDAVVAKANVGEVKFWTHVASDFEVSDM